MRRFLMATMALGILAGCEKGDTQREALEAADRRVKVGAYREAIRSYEAALDGSAKTADIHYKIAVLYDNKLKEPLDAIHHYGRYLELAPDGTHAKEAKASRAGNEKRLQAKMSNEGFMTTTEAARLRNENESLRKVIIELRNPKPPQPPRTPEPSKADALPPGSKHYTVVSGDTLASISMKFYKTRSMSGHIKDANFNQLGGKDIIRPGQVLIIPEAPKRRR